jgi:hypothetical protein
MREVLFAAATPRTPRFNDYTPGSYHADKMDLAAALPSQAAECGVRLRALIVLGPEGILWTYHIIAVLQDGDSLRINSLAMPHARIVSKAGGRVSLVRFDSLFAELTAVPFLAPGPPSLPDSFNTSLRREFAWNVLATLYTDSGRALWHGTIGPTSDTGRINAVMRPINALLSGLKVTYALTPRRS